MNLDKSRVVAWCAIHLLALLYQGTTSIDTTGNKVEHLADLDKSPVVVWCAICLLALVYQGTKSFNTTDNKANLAVLRHLVELWRADRVE